MALNKKRPTNAINSSTKVSKSTATEVKKDKPSRKHATRMEEIRWDPNGLLRENPYYLRIATRFQIVKYVTIVLALAFAVTMMTAFSSDITAENFQYLLKDLDLSGLAAGNTFDALLYNGGADSVFGIYRNELVVISPGNVSLYKPSAALSFHKSNIYYNPHLLTSNKYFLVYDRGDTSRSYSVFNSFAELKTETYSYPITGAAMSDSGYYALVTRDDSFRGIVRMYDDSFRQIMEIKKDKYILSIDISHDGKTLAVASVYDRDGDFVTEIMTVRAGDSEANITITEQGILPLRVKFMRDNAIGVLFNNQAKVYNADGTERSALSYSSMPSVHAELSESYVCAVYNTSVIGNDKTVAVYDVDGQMVFTTELKGELNRIVPHENLVCLLFEDKAVQIDIRNGTVATQEVEPNALAIVYADATPMICYSGNASVLHFESQSN